MRDRRWQRSSRWRTLHTPENSTENRKNRKHRLPPCESCRHPLGQVLLPVLSTTFRTCISAHGSREVSARGSLLGRKGLVTGSFRYGYSSSVIGQTWGFWRLGTAISWFSARTCQNYRLTFMFSSSSAPRCSSSEKSHVLAFRGLILDWSTVA